MTENRVVALRQKGAIDDPLTEILRTGARRLIAQAVEAEFETFLASTANSCFRMAADGWFATAMIRFARSRPESARSKCKNRRPVIEARRRARGYGSRRTSCPNGRGAPRGSTPFCPFSICAGFSAGDFQEALAALLGKDAPNLSSACYRAPQERMGGRIPTMAEARFVGAPLRLRLGGRRLFAGAHGAAGRMHAGADGRDARGQSFDKLRRS